MSPGREGETTRGHSDQAVSTLTGQLTTAKLIALLNGHFFSPFCVCIGQFSIISTNYLRHRKSLQSSETQRLGMDYITRRKCGVAGHSFAFSFCTHCFALTDLILDVLRLPDVSAPVQVCNSGLICSSRVSQPSW